MIQGAWNWQKGGAEVLDRIPVGRRTRGGREGEKVDLGGQIREKGQKEMERIRKKKKLRKFVLIL